MIISRIFYPYIRYAGVAGVALLAGCGSPATNPALVAARRAPPAPVTRPEIDSQPVAGGPQGLRWPMMLVELGQADSGVAAARALLDARGDDPPFAIQVAHIAAVADRPAAAGEIYRQVLAKHPDNVDALVGDGVVLARADDLDAAMGRFRQALVLKPADIAARNNLAMALILAGQPEQALPILELLSQDPAASDLVRANLVLAHGSLPAATPAPARHGTATRMPDRPGAEVLVATPVGVSAELPEDPPAAPLMAPKPVKSATAMPVATPVGIHAELPEDPPIKAVVAPKPPRSATALPVSTPVGVHAELPDDPPEEPAAPTPQRTWPVRASKLVVPAPTPSPPE